MKAGNHRERIFNLSDGFLKPNDGAEAPALKREKIVQFVNKSEIGRLGVFYSWRTVKGNYIRLPIRIVR